MKSVIISLCILIFSHQAISAGIKTVSGTINRVQVMGTNYPQNNTAGEAIAFIYMDNFPISCGNAANQKRVAITSSHPAFSAVLSSALAAKATQQTVKIDYYEECTLWNKAWDFAVFNTI